MDTGQEDETHTEVQQQPSKEDNRQPSGPARTRWDTAVLNGLVSAAVIGLAVHHTGRVGLFTAFITYLFLIWWIKPMERQALAIFIMLTGGAYGFDLIEYFENVDIKITVERINNGPPISDDGIRIVVPQDKKISVNVILKNTTDEDIEIEYVEAVFSLKGDDKYVDKIYVNETLKPGISRPVLLRSDRSFAFFYLANRKVLIRVYQGETRLAQKSVDIPKG